MYFWWMRWRVFGIAFLLLFTILFYSLRLSITFLHYAVFNDSFTEMYCVNTDKPELKCNGKCHLEKDYDDENSAPKDFYLNKNLHENIWLFVGDFTKEEKLPFKTFNPQQTVRTIDNFYKFTFTTIIFEPPII